MGRIQELENGLSLPRFDVGPAYTGGITPYEILGAICLFRLVRGPVHAFRIADSILRSSLTHSIAVVTNYDLCRNSGKMALRVERATLPVAAGYQPGALSR
jgi:hypothetical protein